MANFIASPNMSLPVPTVGIAPGPDWASNVNAALVIIDQHNHSSGSGVQITPNGLNINSALTFNNNPAINAAYLNITPQGAGIPTPANASLYVQGVDLFYRDGAGNNITITQGGNVLASSSGISSGTASAAFSGSILTVIQSPGVAAAIDAASYILRYNGSYPTPAGQAVVLQAPSFLPGGYALTFPTGLPSLNNAILVGNTAGALTFLSSDQVAQNMTSVGANSIASTMTSTGADTIAVTMTSTGANSIASKFTNLQSGGKNVVTSQVNLATSLSIVRGSVDVNGNIIIGEGFTSVKNTTGIYTISFTSAFASTPAITVSPIGGVKIVSINNTPNASGFGYSAFTTGSVTNDTSVSFIAIGPR